MQSTMITAGRLIERARRVGARRRAHPHRQGDAGALEQLLHVAAPADGHGHRADRVLEDEVPADDPGEQLAHRRVGVGVGAAGDRNHRGELGVAQRREPAGQAGEQIRHHDRRPGLVGRGGAGEHEDAGADDRADAQQRQVPRRQAAPERLAAVLDVPDQLFDRLRLQQVRIHSASTVPFTRPAPAATAAAAKARQILSIGRAQRHDKAPRACLRRLHRRRRRSPITATADAPAAITAGAGRQRDAADRHQRHARRRGASCRRAQSVERRRPDPAPPSTWSAKIGP